MELRESIDFNQFKNLQLPLPPKAEQDRIVEFLDRKTSQIDALIEKKQRLLKLLDEQLAIKINNAVTKGIVNPEFGTLNPHLSTPNNPIYTTHTSPLKNSNIEWIGEIPEEWEIIQIQRCVMQQDYGLSEAATDEGQFMYLGMGQIKDREITPTAVNRLDSCPPELLLEENDLLFNRTNSLELVGKTGIYKKDLFSEPEKTTFASYLVRLKTSENFNPEWLNYLMSDSNFLASIRSMALPSLHQANLTFSRAGVTKIVTPKNEDEQLKIASFLNRETGNLKQVKHAIDEEILKLEKIKSITISNAVTGKSK